MRPFYAREAPSRSGRGFRGLSAPVLNNLPSYLRQDISCGQFRRQLKHFRLTLASWLELPRILEYSS